MKFTSRPLFIIISIILSLFSAFLGTWFGLSIYRILIPPWKHYEISALQGAKDIYYVDIQSTLDDPTKDTLYVASEKGKVYSYSLSQKVWHVAEIIPKQDHKFPPCATDWKDNPPVKNVVIDSAGVRFERPLSTILRCYVLFDDGSSQVWTQSTDVFNLMLTVVISGLLGLVVGIIVINFIQRKASKPAVIVI